MTTTGLQHGETIQTPSTEHFSPRWPQSSQYVISLSPVIVSFPALKMRNHVSFYPLLLWQPLTNDWTWILIPKLFVKWLNQCNMLPCRSVFNVSGLGNVVTCSDNIPSYYCISPYWHKSCANCPLLMGRFYLIFLLFIFRADDSLTAQNPPPGEYFNLFVVCSWMQVMELCL